MFRASVVLCCFVIVGCVQGPSAPPESSSAPSISAEWYENALVNDSEHDHFDYRHHLNMTTSNFNVVAWDPLETERFGPHAGGLFCGDLKQRGERTIVVVHSFTSDVAFIIADVTNPENPEKIGELVMEQTHVWDLALTPDQQFVVLATSPEGAADSGSPTPPRTLLFRDACDGSERALRGPEAALPYESGVALVDISNPRDPRVADFIPLGGLGAHSVVAEDLDGTTVILATVSHAGPGASYYLFLGLTSTLAGARFEPYSVYETDVQEQIDTLVYANHDGFLQVHPVTGRHIAYLADGYSGVGIVDITDVRQPVALAQWDRATEIANPAVFEHVAHSTYPIDELWDGRHYTFVTEECPGRPADTPSCLIYVLDTTDPEKPTLAGAWTLPVELGSWAYPGFSPHYLTHIGRTLFVAHWHAGLWAFDVSTPEKIRTLPPIGVFMPEEDRGYVPDGGLNDAYNQRPVVADVLRYGERLVTFDGTTGLYLLEFDEANPAPPAPTWPLNFPTD